MTIEGSFYKMTPIDDSSPLYDLELLYEIKKGKNPRKEFKIEAYGIPLDRAIERCINYTVRHSIPETVTLKEYLDEYKKQAKSIKEELQKIGINA